MADTRVNLAAFWGFFSSGAEKVVKMTGKTEEARRFCSGSTSSVQKQRKKETNNVSLCAVSLLLRNKTCVARDKDI